MRLSPRLLVVSLLVSLLGVVSAAPAQADTPPANWACYSQYNQNCISEFGYHGQSVWGYPVDSWGNNCTNYAAFRLAQNGAPNPGNLGNADKWDDNARAKGFPVDQTPRVGSIAQWDSMHVAYVDWVSSDGNQVAISESGYDITIGGTHYPSMSGRRVLTRGTSKWPSNFIHIKDVDGTPLPPPPPSDSDSDGIPDPSDRCPTVPGWSEYVGCPEDIAGVQSSGQADFNGDGRSDYCRRVGDSSIPRIQCTLGTASGFGATYESPNLDWGYRTGRAWADINGDRRADYCRRVGNSGDGRVQCTLSTGAGFGATWTSDVLDWGYEFGRAWVDFNGDRRADYCRVVGNSGDGRVQCTLATSTGFGATVTSPVLDWGYDFGRAWVDVNNDGRSDYCRVVGNSGDGHVQCTLSAASSFGATWTSAAVDWGYVPGRAWVDMNGDHRADFCRVVGNAGDGHVQCTLGGAAGFGATITSGVLDWGYDWNRDWSDVNGDGRTDYCRHVGDGSDPRVRCTLSTGTAFGDSWTSEHVDWGYQAGRSWKDVNGDRRADFCRVVGNSGDGHVQCTLSVAAGFGSTSTSGVLDWGYDAGRYWTGSADVVAPKASPKPVSVFRASSSVAVSFTGSDLGSGIGSYDVRWRRAAYNAGWGAWQYPSTWQRQARNTVTHNGLERGFTYCYQVRARDRAGNLSAWVGGSCTSVALDDRALSGAGWTAGTGSAFYASTYKAAGVLNRVLARSGAQLTGVAVVARKCPTCGMVGVYVGTTLVGKLNLYAATKLEKQVLALPRFSYRTGTVTLKVLSSGKQVLIDGLGISRA